MLAKDEAHSSGFRLLDDPDFQADIETDPQDLESGYNQESDRHLGVSG